MIRNNRGASRGIKLKAGSLPKPPISLPPQEEQEEKSHPDTAQEDGEKKPCICCLLSTKLDSGETDIPETLESGCQQTIKVKLRGRG